MSTTKKLTYELAVNTPHGTKLVFAGSQYPFRGMLDDDHPCHFTHCYIEDEPGHVDIIRFDSLRISKKAIRQ